MVWYIMINLPHCPIYLGSRERESAGRGQGTGMETRCRVDREGEKRYHGEKGWGRGRSRGRLGRLGWRQLLLGDLKIFLVVFQGFFVAAQLQIAVAYAAVQIGNNGWSVGQRFSRGHHVLQHGLGLGQRVGVLTASLGCLKQYIRAGQWISLEII